MKTKQLFIALILALGLTLALSTTVFADDITVNTTDDELNTDGDCSLREAIQAANTDSIVDACHTGSGHDTLIITPTGTITLTGQLEITSSLTISGPGAGSLSISGNGASRVITTSSGITVTITGVTIRDGSATDGGGIYNYGMLMLTNSSVISNTASQSGGGIYNTITGTLTIRNTTIATNTADGNDPAGGGGIMNLGALTLDGSIIGNNFSSNKGGGIHSNGTMTVTNSVLRDNTADSNGGGIRNSGMAYIANSTITANTADVNTDGFGDGGGIDQSANAISITLTLVNSTISGNSAVNCGGIRNLGFTSGLVATMTITNSTISGNTASEHGGGICNWRNLGDATLTITNSTIADNIADNDANTSGDGGGIHIWSGAHVSVKNTIIADNTDSSLTGQIYPDCSGTLNSRGYNLLEYSAGCTMGAVNNIIGRDPNLGPLIDNGGDTWTHALQPGSPAVNAGTCAGAPVTDQRGVSRPQPLLGACDIGAYEAQAELALIKSADDDTPNPGQLVTFTIIVSNSSALTTTNGLVSDTLDSGSFTLAGPIVLNPAGAGTTGTLPVLVSGLTITPGECITVTFPVTVNAGLSGGDVLTNTAAITSTTVTTPQTGLVTMAVNSVPVASDVITSTDEDVPLHDTLDASDPDVGDTLIYGILTDPVSGTVTITDISTGDFIYTPTNDLYGDDSFTYIVTDTGNLTDTARVTVTVNPVNDAPENTVPSAQVTDEDTALIFSSGTGKQISTSDVDIGSNPVSVTLNATNGTLSLSGTSNLTFYAGDGTADATMTFTGTIANVNAALDGLVFSPTLNYNGAASVQITPSHHVP